MIEDQEQRRKKREQLLEQQKKSEEEQLQKSMMTSKLVTKSRTHDEFLADQIKYEQHRFEKLKQHIEKEEEEFNYKPHINKKSQKILSKKGVENAPAAHERLYQTKEQKTLKTQDSEEQLLFKPQINEKSKKIKREGKIEDILYSDAEKKKMN